MTKKDLVYLLDIKDAINEIDTFIRNNERDLRTYRAIERNIEIIGEACSKISQVTKDKYPHIAWRAIKSMRNMIAHEYSRVSYERVWSIADKEIYELLEQVEEIIKSYQD